MASEPEAGMDSQPSNWATAREYLTAVAPSSTSDFQIGDGWEDEDFLVTREAWLSKASESTLNELTDIADCLLAQGDLSVDVAWNLIESHRRRGIPSIGEMRLLANRIPNAEVAETLRRYRD